MIQREKFNYQFCRNEVQPIQLNNFRYGKPNVRAKYYKTDLQNLILSLYTAVLGKYLEKLIIRY